MDESSPGRRLRPSTVEIIRVQIKEQLQFRSGFADQFFPAAARRRAVTYEDVEDMNWAQAEATANSLVRSVNHLQKMARQKRRDGIGMILAEGERPSNSALIKSRQYATALDDLCSVFGLRPRR